MQVKAAAWALLALASCESSQHTAPGCRSDDACAGPQACVAGRCVPRLPVSGQVFAVEVLPRSSSIWAPTELAMVTFATTAVAFKVERKIEISGSVTRTDTDPDTAQAATARIALALPSAIPNRPTWLFHAEGISLQPRAPIEFQLSLPENARGQIGAVRVVPLPPLDRTTPPWKQGLVAIDGVLAFEPPGAADLIPIEGTIRTAFDDPARGYVVRALEGDRVVSNVVPSDDQGRFRLRIGRRALETGMLTKVAIQVTAATGEQPRNRLLVRGVSEMRPNLGTLRLPAEPLPQAFDVPVTPPAGGSTERIAGVLLRFQTALAGAVGGEFTFRREVQSDTAGVAHVRLLPGTQGQVREYTVAAIPPPNSPFAVRCVRSYSVAPGSPTEVSVGRSIELEPRAELTGQVLSARGEAVGGVRITAIRRADDLAFCPADLATPPATVTTESDGSYRLWLDPGRYRIEYEPPRSSAPLAVEDEVMVTTSTRRQVALPLGALAEGLVQSPSGAGVDGCEVRLYDPVEGTLRGRGVTDENGNFRVVVAVRP